MLRALLDGGGGVLWSDTISSWEVSDIAMVVLLLPFLFFFVRPSSCFSPFSLYPQRERLWRRVARGAETEAELTQTSSSSSSFAVFSLAFSLFVLSSSPLCHPWYDCLWAGAQLGVICMGAYSPTKALLLFSLSSVLENTNPYITVKYFTIWCIRGTNNTGHVDINPSTAWRLMNSHAQLLDKQCKRVNHQQTQLLPK